MDGPSITRRTPCAGVVALIALLSTPAATVAAPCDFDHTHRAWSDLLGRYVDDGVVGYAALRAGARAPLQAYLATLAAVPTACDEAWTREQRLAFWLNAYNAYTVELILDEWPVRSIRSIGFLPGAAFRRRFVPMARLGRQSISLDDIEHRIVRPTFGDARIHFALVCAATGCPPLRSEAYQAPVLDAQLTEQARRFIGDPTKNRFDGSAGVVRLSAIFKWFAEDFEAEKGTVRAYVLEWAAPPLADGLRDATVSIEYLDYDWSLNGK